MCAVLLWLFLGSAFCWVGYLVECKEKGTPDEYYTFREKAATMTRKQVLCWILGGGLTAVVAVVFLANELYKTINNSDWWNEEI